MIVEASIVRFDSLALDNGAAVGEQFSGARVLEDESGRFILDMESLTLQPTEVSPNGSGAPQVH